MKRNIVLSGREEIVKAQLTLALAIDQIVQGCDWPFLQRWLMSLNGYNGKVRDYFANVSDDQPILIGTPAANKAACLITDDDTSLSALHKRLNFYFEVLEGHLNHFYEGPTHDNAVILEGQPLIILKFIQDRNEYKFPRPKHLGEGRISFRIMNRMPEQVTPADINRWGAIIKSNFIGSSGYVWEKGVQTYTYTDKKKGYSLKIYANSKFIAKDLVQKILQIQGHVPEWKRFKNILNEDSDAAYRQSETTNILGESVELPSYRPEVKVRFSHAIIHLPPAKPKVLIDRTKRKGKPLVEL